MKNKKSLFAFLVVFSSMSWGSQTEIKVTGTKAQAILAAFAYTLTNFPIEGRPVTKVQCDSNACSYESHSEKASTQGTMIGTKELISIVQKCKDAIVSQMNCKVNIDLATRLKYDCIATCQNE